MSGWVAWRAAVLRSTSAEPTADGFFAGSDGLVFDLRGAWVLLFVARPALAAALVLGRARALSGGPGGEVAADPHGEGHQQGQEEAEGPPRCGRQESGAHGSILEGLPERTLPERLIIPQARTKNQGRTHLGDPPLAAL